MPDPVRVIDVAAPVKVPKTAELVATQLRNQIIRGELREGDALPPESTLMEQFAVSRPTLREAFRVLESEALISVRRGARGGARVHAPNGDVAARVRRARAAVPRRDARRRVRGPEGHRAPCDRAPGPGSSRGRAARARGEPDCCPRAHRRAGHRHPAAGRVPSRARAPRRKPDALDVRGDAAPHHRVAQPGLRRSVGGNANRAQGREAGRADPRTTRGVPPRWRCRRCRRSVVPPHRGRWQLCLRGTEARTVLDLLA